MIGIEVLAGSLMTLLEKLSPGGGAAWRTCEPPSERGSSPRTRRAESRRHQHSVSGRPSIPTTRPVERTLRLTDGAVKPRGSASCCPCLSTTWR